MTRYHSPREVAHAIQDAAPIKLGLLFYNEHSPDTTPVWLLPDPYEKPAHHRAKVGVWPWGKDGTEVFVQWCVEKGVEGSAAAHFSFSDVLSPEWAWTRFTELARRKEFDTHLRAAELTAGVPLTVSISLGTATPGSGRDYKNIKSQQVVWQTQKGQLIRQEQHREVQQSQVFNDQLSDADSVRTLAFFLPQTTEIDWCWIDFGVGVVLPLRQDTLGGAALWARFLAPWEDLL